MKKWMTQVALFSSTLMIGIDAFANNQSDAEFVYSQLKSLQHENAGHPDFDFRFAKLAMAIHKYDEAIFALERLLQNDPRNGRVRVELARCYYETGQYHLSRSLFDQIKESEGVPQTVRNNINYYLHQMDQRGSDFDLQNHVYVEAGMGHDSNVNAGSDLSNISIPNLGVVDLTDASQSQSDSTRQKGAGIYLAKATSRHRTWSLAAHVKDHSNREVSEFDQRSFDADLSYHLKRGDNRFRFALQYQRLELGDTAFLDSQGVVAQWIHKLGDNLQIGGSINISDVSFAGDNHYRDHLRQIASGEIIHASGSWAQRLALFIGREAPKADRYDYALRDAIRGLSYRLSYKLNPNLIPYFASQYSYGDYGDRHPVFQQVRSDSFRAYEVGMLWQPSSQWIVNPSLIDARTQSDIEAYSYDRERAQVNVRYNF